MVWLERDLKDHPVSCWEVRRRSVGFLIYGLRFVDEQ